MSSNLLLQHVEVPTVVLEEFNAPHVFVNIGNVELEFTLKVLKVETKIDLPLQEPYCGQGYQWCWRNS